MSHKYIRAWKDGKNVYQHRLIWEKAHGAIPKDMTIDHINGNTKDNRLENLQVLSLYDNQLRSRRGSVSKLAGNRKRPFDGHRTAFGKLYRKTFGTPGGAQMFINTCLLGGSTCAMS